MPLPSSKNSGLIRVAVVGAGRMAHQHIKAIGLSTIPAVVVAVVDPSEGALDTIRSIAPAAGRFQDLDTMLEEIRPDVVHIVTPPATHRALAGKSIEAGCHVYIEKPLTETLEEAQALLTLAQERGVVLCPGHQLLFEPVALKCRDLLPALGRLVHVESYFSFRPVRRLPGGRAPQRTDHQFLDILPHPVYLLLDYLRLAGNSEPRITRLEIGPPGTVHALVSQDGVTGTLVVTLSGRPIESYVRLVGTNGTITLDFVRGTSVRLLGPGTSGIDKAQAPYRLSWQSVTGTTAALMRRVLKRQLSYPGLRELFEEFYRSTRTGKPPFEASTILQTVALCQAVRERIDALGPAAPAPSAPGPLVVVTGATGFLGRAVVQSLLARGARIRALARRLPAPWDRLSGVDYREANLGAKDFAADWCDGATAVIHCAAETAGGWDDHQRNSIDATETALRVAARSGAKTFIHVSSIAVLDGSLGKLSEATPLEPSERSNGPYVWGKLVSERLAVSLGAELGVEVKVVRPGAIVDYQDFEPPGRLGKRLGNFFVAVGSPADRLGVVDITLCGDTLAWFALAATERPAVANLVGPHLPQKRQLIKALRRLDPDLKVIWLPRLALVPLSVGLILLQKLLRPSRPAMNVAKIFSVTAVDTALIARLVPMIEIGKRTAESQATKLE